MKQAKVGYNHGSKLNTYIVYKLSDFNNTEDSKIRNTNNPAFTGQNCLFGAVKITANVDDESKYTYSGYGICFDGKGNLSFSDATNGKNVMTLGVDMTPYYPPITEGEKSYSKEEQYNRDNKIYVLGSSFIQGFSNNGGGHAIDNQKL